MASIDEIIRYIHITVYNVLEYYELHFKNFCPDSMLRAKKYIEENYTKKELDLKTIARFTGYNEKYFCTMFKKQSQITPAHYRKK